ncbi:type 1 glutamine amidotransferase domain-containing protein [Thalassotalea ganghwensis]
MSFGIKRLITTLILLGGLLSGQSDAALQQKVLFILSADKHGYFLPEVVEPYQVLLEQGFIVDFASPNGDKGYPAAENQLSDNEQAYYKGLLAQGAITQPKKLADIDANDYLAFYVPGGAGPMFDLADNPDVQRLTKEFLRQDKIVAAVCHGPAAFVNVKLDNGEYLATSRKITAKSNDEEGDWARANYPFLLQDKFESQDAQFRFAKPNQPFVIYDRGVLTGQNPASATPVAQRLAQLLKGS